MTLGKPDEYYDETTSVKVDEELLKKSVNICVDETRMMHACKKERIKSWFHHKNDKYGKDHYSVDSSTPQSHNSDLQNSKWINSNSVRTEWKTTKNMNVEVHDK